MAFRKRGPRQVKAVEKENKRLTGIGVKPDARFNSILVSKFINCMMYDGKKSVAESVFYDAMDIIAKRKLAETPLEVFETAIKNVMPKTEVRSKRVGGANYQVPVEVPEKRSRALAFRWILESSRKKKGKPMRERLAAELTDAFKKEGDSMQKREATHKMAEANKAFAHFGR